MKISEIHFYNFKGFKGLHKLTDLDQNLSNQKNTILIGGYNGAGKTSVLEAMFLCFYGAGANKLYPSRGARNENYNSFISALLNSEQKYHRNIDADMYVEVFLKEVELAAGFTRDISLKRRWEFNFLNVDSRPNESFVILENAKPIEGIEESEYQERIDTILPYNVSQFFFFDGEKIQDFASDTDNEFANSLKDVLGINLYSTLGNDLKTVRSRILTDYNKNKESGLRIREKELEREKSLTQIENNKIEITNSSDDINGLEEEAERYRTETKRATRISATTREEYQKNKEKLQEEKEFLEKEYVEQSRDIFPFLLNFPLCQEIEEQLHHEEKLKTIQAAQKEVEPKIQHIVSGIFEQEPEDVKLRPNQRRYYEYKIDHVIRQFLLQGKDTEIDEKELIHNLSEPDARKLLASIKNIKEVNVNVLNGKADRLKQIEITLDKIKQTENKGGDNTDEIQKLLDGIKTKEQEIGRKKQRVDDLIHDNKELERKIEFLNRDITNYESVAVLNDKQRKQIEYCDKMQIVIKEFQKEYQAKRTHELEAAIKEMWNRLSHKTMFVKDIRVMPDSNFEVKLYDTFNNEIDKTKMSAGEREIYAIALLWALVQVSGKKLPIIIDTPFGRLDSLHRKNLVQYYFPKASHQVILLSQDEEIVNDYYKILEPCISNEFTIMNQGDESIIKEGYPFKYNELVSQ